MGPKFIVIERKISLQTRVPEMRFQGIRRLENQKISRGCAPGPPWGAYSAPRPPTVFLGRYAASFLLGVGGGGFLQEPQPI